MSMCMFFQRHYEAMQSTLTLATTSTVRCCDFGSPATEVCSGQAAASCVIPKCPHADSKRSQHCLAQAQTDMSCKPLVTPCLWLRVLPGKHPAIIISIPRNPPVSSGRTSRPRLASTTSWSSWLAVVGGTTGSFSAQLTSLSCPVFRIPFPSFVGLAQAVHHRALSSEFRPEAKQLTEPALCILMPAR